MTIIWNVLSVKKMYIIALNLSLIKKYIYICGNNQVYNLHDYYTNYINRFCYLG